ncbi:MAG: hypothetical protein E6G66_17590 [Actinobacteria bacterium]|nr:MAG: hypothetical protein E6G66_17590 [Actinomycetota bacterium]
MRKLGLLVASGIAVGSMVLASPAAWANDYRHRDRDDRRSDYSYGRHFTLGVRIVDTDSDDRGRRGPSRGDWWSVTFNLLDYRNRVGDGFANCVVTSIRHRDWRDSKSRCNVAFRLPDGELRMDGTIDGDDFDDGHATLPISGGSGQFRGADGKTVFRPTGGYYRHDRGRGRDLTAEVDVH